MEAEIMGLSNEQIAAILDDPYPPYGHFVALHEEARDRLHGKWKIIKVRGYWTLWSPWEVCFAGFVEFEKLRRYIYKSQLLNFGELANR